MRPLILATFALAFAACSSPEPAVNPLITARPYDIDVPKADDGKTPLPLIVLVHGYGATGLLQDLLFGFRNLADLRDVLVAHPDGTVDQSGMRFWNATDACCNFYGSDVDDVAYLDAVVKDVERNHNVDKNQVFFVGHSNGGFMSHRMGCDDSDTVVALAAFAGDNYKDASKCNPSRPVPALQIHGDADTEVPYDGDGNLVPSAMDSIGVWAAKNGCSGGLVDTGKTYDFDADIDGAETSGAAWSCPAGAAELWTMHGSGHVPNLNLPQWGETILDWLQAHKRQ